MIGWEGRDDDCGWLRFSKEFRRVEWSEGPYAPFLRDPDDYKVERCRTRTRGEGKHVIRIQVPVNNTTTDDQVQYPCPYVLFIPSLSPVWR